MTDKKIATVRDIASLAGVSPATVSLVLNKKGDISAATRARVLDVVAKANYLPRATARPSLDAGATLRFLKIAKHGHTVNRDHSVFISDYLDAMSAEASERSYTLEVVSFEDQPMDAVAKSLAGAPIRGVIVLGTELSETDVRSIQDVGLPTVFIDTFFDVVDANFVNMNNEDAVYKVLSRFRMQGFDRIGFVASHVDTTNFRLRRDAFFRNMSRLGLTVRKGDVLLVESTYEGAYVDTRALIEGSLDLADCYFCTNDIMAFGFVRALKEAGVGIPEDVSVIGFDNLPQSATMEPPLTSIDVSKRKIGSLAIAVLDEIIRTKELQPAVKILVGAELISRSSDRRPQY
ncbi:MAG: LacI family DNA-binding transcriptional regulator [Rhizobiaceae bacterium]|nr:LacI family DNA-binding transcriptional regulator [Rhizobiaceae bacterium]